ncbi:Clp protease-domain-containing protein [Baffinella frigidus]|nr:Clp protease-domain-containing protein [Cryptophyta sp. CCMP2293]
MRVLRACLALCAAAPALGFLAAPLASPHALAHQRASVLPSASPRAATRPVAGALRMGGANVPRVPYKDPGSDQWQFMDIWNRMYRERILYIGQDLDDEFANQMIAVLLWLNKEDNEKGVQMYFNCPGGEVRAGLAVYDTMNSMGFDITTLNLGIAASISAFLCGAGKKGIRMGLSNVLYGQASDVQIEAQEILRQRDTIFRGFAQFTGKTEEQMRKDCTRDLYLTAPEAVEYGLIDKVLLPMQRTAADYKKMAGSAQYSKGLG